MSLTAVILAAGQSTRMKSVRPKPLHDICGRPMLEYILRACWDAGCSRVIVVVGYGKEEVIARFGHDGRITWVEQAERKGTGHAVQVCLGELKKLQGEVLIIAGDVPLVRGGVLKTLLRTHREEHVTASMATAMLDDPTGYGRIVRDETGQFAEIREHIDCSPEQRQIKEVFPSIYCVHVEELIWSLQQLKNDNKKSEYYLTDIYRHLRGDGKRVLALPVLAAEDMLAPNSRQELARADALMQGRIVRGLRDSGVTIVNEQSTYIEDGVAIGQDTVVYPFSFIGRDATVGDNCTIGPFAMVPRGSVLAAGSIVAGNINADTAVLKS
ncbi:MAG: NTP transferase domain-containing protein [Tepidisphaeraceae bacterium]|jgi:bifunctional UDP-N-acetylglucosamine pyrophosphorylase/glucosamine-1-phosphate N-acetyltransferase